MKLSPYFCLRLVLAAALVCVGLARARAQQPTPAPTPRSNAAIAGDFVLKNRSTFTPVGEGGSAGRNPFLPIGYVRPVAAARVEAAPEVRAEQFVVTSTLLDVPPLAVVNGKSYTVGERIPVDATGREFVTVKQIGDGFVVLDHRGRQLRSVSGLRRPASR